MRLVSISLNHFCVLFQQNSYFTCRCCCFITTVLYSTEPYCSNISFFHNHTSVLQQYAWGPEVQAWSTPGEYALVFIKHLLHQWQYSRVRWCGSAPRMLKAPICAGMTDSDSLHTSLGDGKCCAPHFIMLYIVWYSYFCVSGYIIMNVIEHTITQTQLYQPGFNPRPLNSQLQWQGHLACSKAILFWGHKGHMYRH